MTTVTIIGPGRLGGALAIALPRAGFSLEKVIYRSKIQRVKALELGLSDADCVRLDEIDHIGSDLVIIATSDGDIRAAAEAICSKLAVGTIVLHTSGALSSLDLSPVSDRGNPVGSVHPLVSVSDARLGSDSFAGRYFCVEGSPEALIAAKDIVEKLGGIPFAIDSDLKPLYHAAASMASGHLVALIEISLGCLSACGLDQEFAKKIILPLVESTVANLSLKTPAFALTGPFARADAETIKMHLDVLEQNGLIEERAVYVHLGTRAIDLAEKARVDAARVTEVRELINLAKAKSK